MKPHDCAECIRRSKQIFLLQSEASRLRRATFQCETPLPDNPADWLLGVESDETIRDQLTAIGQEVTRLRKEQTEHLAAAHPRE